MGRIPVVLQMTPDECGAACLAMVLAHHGRRARLEEIRDQLRSGRDGTSGAALLAAAARFGLEGRGVRLEPAELRLLGRAAILHWEFSHFVVLDRLRAGAVDIVDPAGGRRRVPMAEFGRCFTGVALVLEPASGFQTGGGGGRSPLWSYARVILGQWPLIARIVALSLMLQLFAAGVPLMTGCLIDRVIPHGDHHLLAVLGAGLLMLTGLNFLAVLVRGHLMAHLRAHLDFRTTSSFLAHMLALPYTFFQRRQAGDLLLRLSSNASIREALTTASLSALLDGALASGYLLALLAISPRMAALVTALGILDIAIMASTWGIKQRLVARALSVQARYASYQMEVLGGIETLKAMGAERRAHEQWSNLLAEQLNVSLHQGGVDANVGAFTEAVKMLSSYAILGYGAWLVMQGAMSLGTMMAMVGLAAGFLGPFAALVGAFSGLPMLRSLVDRISDVLEERPEQPERSATPPARLRGRVELRDVGFRYGAEDGFALAGLSLTVEPGRSVAVVGATGSGKSTLASLMMGLYRPATGQVLYDGVDLAALDLGAVRRQLGVVTQRTALFAGTIRANVALGSPAADLEQVAEACRLACIADEIEALPLGYGTVLPAGGASLSGGQRQRLALARALLGRPAILLLDEATSSLDAITEQRVHEQWRRLECTRIIIAHRLSTVIDADLILVMERGRLVGRGSHDELLATCPAYAQLVAAQLMAPAASAGLR